MALYSRKSNKQKMMDDLDIYSFIEKLNEYMAFAKNQQWFLAR